MKRENETFEMDPRDMVQQNRSARRKARMSKIGQDRFAPKVEKLKVRYNRKQKHKGGGDNG
jgi:hypothetical protein